jgi:hypothetical protein
MTRLRATVVVTGCVALLVLLISQQTARAVIPNLNFVGLVNNGNMLVRFASASPGTVANTPITGMIAGETMRGIDFRPATSVLYGVATDPSNTVLRLYLINPLTGAARPFASQTSPLTAGTLWGMSFQPVVDRIRVVNENGENARLNPNTGTLAGDDTNLNPGSPYVDSVAYSNQVQGATLTTLYAIDVVTDMLVTIGSVNGTPTSPNLGTVFNVGALGVDAGSFAALDFTREGVLYAVLRVGASHGLYTIDPATGAATLVGTIGASSLAIASLAVRDAPAVHMDFDGDARADVAVTRLGAAGSADWFVHRSSDSSLLATNWGFFSSDAFLPADFDGDGKVDLNVWRSGASAIFYRQHSSNGTFVPTQWGTAGDDPAVAGDYDGDAKSDHAVYRVGATTNAQSVWYAQLSSTGSLLAMPFGANDGAGGDTAAPGDYDGDGRADFGVRRRASGFGTFYLQQTTAGFTAIPWGLGSDAVVPGDWDGEGKDDVAVVRNESGTLVWYVRPSASPSTLVSVVWGLAGDYLVPADYDGDGKTDCAVWRPSVGTFYVRRSFDGALIVIPWGLSTDVPIAASFVH